MHDHYNKHFKIIKNIVKGVNNMSNHLKDINNNGIGFINLFHLA